MKRASSGRYHRAQLGDTCPNGHTYTEETSYINIHGRRRCRTCLHNRNHRNYPPKGRQINRLGGICKAGHPLTLATVYAEVVNGKTYYRCIECTRSAAEKWRREHGIAPRPSSSPDEKACTKCGVVKPITDFRQRRTYASGEPAHDSWCFTCKNKPHPARQAKRDAYQRDREQQRTEARELVPWVLAQIGRLRAAGWSVTEVCAALGVATSTISGWRTGNRTPSPELLKQVNDRLVFLVSGDDVRRAA